MAKRYLIIEIEDTVPDHMSEKYLGRIMRHLDVVYGKRWRMWTTKPYKKKNAATVERRTFVKDKEIFAYEDQTPEGSA